MRKLALLALLLVACSSRGGSTRDAVRDLRGVPAVVNTSYGQVTVWQGSYDGQSSPTLNIADVVHALESGYRYAQTRTSEPSKVTAISLDGLTVALCFPNVDHYEPETETMYVSSAQTARHELQHFMAHRLGCVGDCCIYNDHPDGYDLDCERTQ